MKCAVHTDVDSTGFCRNCGKAMCAGCTRDVKGVLYCEDCLAQVVGKPQPAATSGGSPGLAAVLGIIPGLGAVYNGEFMKAVIHVLIFGSLIAMLAQGEGLGFFIPVFVAFCLYMPIEAYRTAKAKMLGQTPPGPLSELRGGQPIGAFVLIGLGVIFLLDEFVPGFHFGRLVAKGWPLILILIGVFMLRKRMRGGP